VLAAQEPYQVTRPAQRADLAAPVGNPDELHPRPQLSADSVIVPIRPQPIDGMPSYHGVFVLAWDGTHRPTQVDVALAQIIVDRACAVVHDTRLATLLARERERARNLEIALESNREIGTAIGILMARELLTSTQAFDQLRQVSQNTHRKLRAVAGDVILTGKLDPSIGCAEAPGLRLALVEPDGHDRHDEHHVPGRAPE
jgi:hypothetical protein